MRPTPAPTSRTTLRQLRLPHESPIHAGHVLIAGFLFVVVALVLDALI